MPEAVIVATARSPIGRAFKGSLKDLRPDDLAATIVRAALDKVPALDPTDIDDLMLGCGLPGGEQGYNMGRVVATLLGMDHLPGTTITRYCSSSRRDPGTGTASYSCPFRPFRISTHVWSAKVAAVVADWTHRAGIAGVLHGPRTWNGAARGRRKSGWPQSCEPARRRQFVRSPRIDEL